MRSSAVRAYAMIRTAPCWPRRSRSLIVSTRPLRERRRPQPSTPFPSKHRNKDSTMNDAARKINNVAPPPAVSLREALRYWLKLGFISFGGPAGQIAIMHQELVERRRWISERRFLHALNYCMVLPGPEAQQLAIYIGWLLHRTWGGLVAGFFFVLPGIVAIMMLSWLYAGLGDVPIVEALFFGLKAAVLAIVLEAVVRIGRRALKNGVMLAIAAAAFVAIFVFDVLFPFIILAAGIIGFVGGKTEARAFLVGGAHGNVGDRALADAALGED